MLPGTASAMAVGRGTAHAGAPGIPAQYPRSPGSASLSSPNHASRTGVPQLRCLERARLDHSLRRGMGNRVGHSASYPVGSFYLVAIGRRVGPGGATSPVRLRHNDSGTGLRGRSPRDCRFLIDSLPDVIMRDQRCRIVLAAAVDREVRKESALFG